MRPKLGIPEGLASCSGGVFELNRADCDKESPTLKDASARVDVGGEDDLESSVGSSVTGFFGRSSVKCSWVGSLLIKVLRAATFD